MSIKKKLRVSKNRKKSWRKHTKIEEIEEFLDNKRFEERIGFSVTEVKNEDLFMIEKTGDDTAYEKKLETIRAQENIRIGESKLRQIALGYKKHSKLESTSKVPPVGSRSATIEKRKTIYNDDEKLKKYWNEKKELIEAGRKLRERKQQLANDSASKLNTYDLWDENGPQIEVKVPVHLRQKPSLLPAVEVPVPGQSYNPDPDDHNQLIRQAATTEIDKANEEQFWANKVEKHFVSKENAPNEKTWFAEMSQGLGMLPEEREEFAGEDEAPNDEIVSFTKQVRAENKKTKSQRRRELREKMAKKQKEKAKNLKMKENQVFRIKTLKRELAERERRLEERALTRQHRQVESLYKPHRLSKFRFEETPIELNLPSEVKGTLREIKVEGNLLQDRFKSLQKRNLIETRVRQTMKRKYKLKKEVKRRHKDGN